MTSQPSIAERKEKIAALKLPPLDPTLPDLYDPNAVAFQEDTEGAAAVDGSIVSFVSGLKSGQKSDVLNSTLLAQLAADYVFDRWKDSVNWYGEYVDVLANVGWVITRFIFSSFKPSASSFKLDESILKILEKIATGDEMEIMAEAMRSLQEGDNEGPLVLFDQQSFPTSAGTFQIYPAQNDDDNVAMAASAMMFKANTHRTKFLWFTWSSSQVSLEAAAQTVVLNEEVYEQVRADVIKKLGDNAIKYVKDIKLGRR